MRSRYPPGRTRQLHAVAAAVALVLVTGLVTATPAAATPVMATATGDSAEQQAVDASVASAAAAGIDQSISVVDRETGALVASSGGDQQYISESIVKLFTVAYYEIKADGRPAESLSRTLRTMIINSDDDIESSLWNVDIVPTIAARYGLADTRNGPKTGPHDWGWELITADDEVKFLYEMSNDQMVAPLLLDAMAHTAPIGADGSDQFFGMNTLTGDHGSKQGWTDANAGSSEPAEIHSVGWTDGYFVAILETSAGPDFDEMRDASTAAAQAVLAAQGNSPVTADDTPAAEPSTTESTPPQPAAQTSTAPPVTTEPPVTTAAPNAQPAAHGAFADVLTALRHDFDLLVADMTAFVRSWN